MKKQDIIIPENFSDLIEKSIQEGKHKRENRLRTKRYVFGLGMSICIIFTLFNYQTTLVKALSNMPLLGDILTLFLFEEKKEQAEVFDLHVEIPQIKNLNSDSLLNQQIKEKIDQKTNEMKNTAYQEYQAYIETGGKKEEYIPMELKIEYRVTCHSNNYISFFLFSSETRATSFQEMTTYTIDATTAKQLTLKDLLGDNYKELIAVEIEEQIKAKDANEQSQYFLFDDIRDYIDEKRLFYINNKEQLVIVFEKYEIATGASGSQEFVMPFSLEGSVKNV